MHQPLSPYNFAPIGLPYTLMTKTDPEEGLFPRPLFHRFEADAGLIGVTGTGRYHQTMEGLNIDLFEGNFVITNHFTPGTQFAKILDQVVGEGIVIIDDKKLHKGVFFRMPDSLACGPVPSVVSHLSE